MNESVTGMLWLCDCKCYFVCIIDNIASDIRYLGCVAPEPESSPLTALSPDTSQIESSPVTQVSLVSPGAAAIQKQKC